MRRGLLALMLAVVAVAAIFVYSNTRRDISTVSAACRQERLQGLAWAPAEPEFHRESLIG